MASHPSPFYRNRQSTKALDPNGPTAKFLYTILKQLDLKNIDWNEVASGLDITNGHAARMRWSRFRAQIEGLDNSYSRQSGKKRDGEKKRKREKQGESIATKETVDQKRIKAELFSDPNRDTTLQPSPYGEARLPTTLKSEHSGKTSTVNGITVHHPKMTTIEIPQLAHKGPIIKQDPFPTGNTSVAMNRTASKSIALAPPAIQSYHPHTFDPDLQWAQQLPNSNYMYQYPSTTNPWSYQPFSSNYAPGYQHSGFYAGQSGQQRSMYSQPQPRIPTPQPNYYPYSSISSSLPATVPGLYNAIMPPSGASLPAKRQSTIPEVSPLTDSCPTQSENHVQNAARLCELAAEASYPWPYSEVSLADLSRNVCEVRDIGNGEDGNLNDFSDTDAEHVVELDVDANAQQSKLSMPNASVADGICNITHEDTTTTNRPTQQAKKSEVSDLATTESNACSQSLPVSIFKSELQL